MISHKRTEEKLQGVHPDLSLKDGPHFELDRRYYP